MDELPIEQTLKPQTVNEVLLINRINELHRKYYFQRRDLEIYLPRHEEEIRVAFPPPVTLQLAASVEAEDLEYPEGIRVSARSYGHGPFTLGYQYYMLERDIKQIGYTGGANLLSMLHDKLIRSLAAKIEELSKAP